MITNPAAYANLFYNHFFWFGLAFTFAFGSCVGSFLNVVIWRMPRGKSLSNPPSHCPNCDKRIKLYDNIPILAWLVLKGRCRNCKVSISPRYIIIEAVTGIMWCIVVYTCGQLNLPLSMAIGMLILTSVLIAASLTDIETRTVPHKLVLFAVGSALTLAVLFPQSQILPSRHALFSIQPTYGFFKEFDIRVEAVLHCIANIFIAFSFMSLCAKLGKRLFGKHDVICDPPVLVTLDKDKCQAEDDEPLKWTEILTEKNDAMELHSKSEGIIKVNREGIAHTEGKSLNLNEPLKTLVTKVSVPTAVIGGGDSALIAACAGFIGIQGSLISLGFASIAGMAYLSFSRHKAIISQRVIPFAPFIALAAWIWILCWPTIIQSIHNIVSSLR